MNSTHDLGNPSCAPWLRTSTSHSSSTIFHLYELTILNRPIGFALQTKSFNNIHVNRSSHRVVRLRIFVEKENSLEVKNFIFSPCPPLLCVEICIILSGAGCHQRVKRQLSGYSSNLQIRLELQYNANVV